MPTIFLTISAAEMKWNELLVILKKVVDNENFFEDDCEKLPWQENCQLIQKILQHVLDFLITEHKSLSNF